MIEDKPLDELYLTWLYSQIGAVRKRRSIRTYWSLARQLYTKQFVHLVGNDIDRKLDGIDLRYEFLDDEGIEDVDTRWMEMNCSMLEMMIALSRRLAFDGGGEPRDWFWLLIRNLRLEKYNDTVDIPHDRIDDILDRVIWRTFQPSGRGGLFPLKRASQDQRYVEIWYQANAYLLEMGAA